MIHEVNTRSFLTEEGILKTKRYGKHSERKLEHCLVHKKGLFWGLAVEGLNINYMQGHILPELGIQVARFGWKAHIIPSDELDYYVDIIHLTEYGNGFWHYRDLYLDVAVFEAKTAEILDTDEYLAAIQADFFKKDEASLALEKTHELMNDLAKFSYSLEAYLEANDIVLEWA